MMIWLHYIIGGLVFSIGAAIAGIGLISWLLSVIMDKLEIYHLNDWEWIMYLTVFCSAVAGASYWTWLCCTYIR